MASRRVKVALVLALLVLGALAALGVLTWRRSNERLFEAGGTVSKIVFSEDGTRIAATTQEGLLRVWSLDGTLLLERHFPPPMERTQVAISPRLDAVASETSALGIYRVSDGSLARWIDAGNLYRVLFSPDGRLLLVAFDGGACAYSADTGERVFQTPASEARQHNACVASGDEILTLPASGTPKLWSRSGKLLRELGPPVVDGLYGASSGDGSACAISQFRSEKNTVQVFRTSDGATLAHLDLGTANLVALSADGGLLAVSFAGLSDPNDRIDVLDVATGRRLGCFPGFHVEFSPRDPVLAWSSDAETKVHLVPLDRLGRWRHLRGEK